MGQDISSRKEAIETSPVNQESGQPVLISQKTNVLGKRVSGKSWKEVQTKRHSDKIKVPKQGWEKRKQDESRLKSIKKTEMEIKKERAEIKEQVKKTAKANRERKEANAKKAEVVQKVSSGKVKRMSKKAVKKLTKTAS